jgi:hypothetical protein
VTSVKTQAAAAGIGYYIATPDSALNGVDTEGFQLAPGYYTAQFSGVTIGGAQDLFSALNGGWGAFRLCELQLTAEGQTSPNDFRLSIKRLGAPAILGSGGTAVTLQPMNNPSAASLTARANDTTRASTTGSTTTLVSASVNVMNGWYYAPSRGLRPVFDVNEAMVIGVESAPASVVFDGYAVIELI